MSQPKTDIAESAKPPHKPEEPAFDPQHQGGKPLQRQDIDHGLSEKGVGRLGTGTDTGAIEPGKSGEGHSLP